jgi:hypothetical protein
LNLIRSNLEKGKGFYLITDENGPKLGAAAQLATEMARLALPNSDRAAGSLRPMSGEAGPWVHVDEQRRTI